MGGLCRLGRQGLVVELASPRRIQGEVELVLPAELKAGLGESIVPQMRAGMAFGDVGGVGSDLVGDYPVFDILLVREAPGVPLG